MSRRMTAALLFAGFASGSAYAANCPTNPYTLTNGSTADASQVMADFNNLLTCANSNLAPIANPNLTGGVTIASGAPYSLDVAGKGRFLSPASGSTGAVIIRDAAGNPNAAILQFVDNANSAQYGLVKGLKTSGLNLTGGPVGINTDTPSLAFFVSGSSGGTAAWTNTSDARLKKNVTEITGALALVENLRGVRYDWRNVEERSVGKTLALPTGERQIGLIAQEVEKIVPEAVSKPKGPEDVYGVKPENLIPVLIEAIKEQQGEIEQLNKRMTALANK